MWRFKGEDKDSLSSDIAWKKWITGGDVIGWRKKWRGALRETTNAHKRKKKNSSSRDHKQRTRELSSGGGGKNHDHVAVDFHAVTSPGTL